MQQQSLSKPVAVVTGASSGFGRLTAEALVGAGYHVYAGVRGIAGRNAAVVAELAAQGIEAVELDVTSDASVEAAAARVLAVAGSVDVLVNNAGSAYFGIAEAFTPDLVREQFEVNVFGALRVNRAFLPSMRERRSGLLVYVSSVVGRFVTPFVGVYAASKFALEALAEAGAYELRPLGVDVAIVEPGAYATNIVNRVVGPDDAARVASYGEVANGLGTMMQSLGATASDRPEEVANAILEIARTAPGSRPLRRVVGAGDGPVPAINATIAEHTRGVLEAWGMPEYLPAVLTADPVPELARS